MDISDIGNLLQTFMQWGFVVIIIVVLVGILMKWGLKKIFPSLVSLFYTLIPTYIINAIVVIALKGEVLNQYAVLKFPYFGYFISPPLVWDSLFGMGLAESRIEILILSSFFIAFLPPWLAWRTTLGLSEEGTKNHLFIKRLLCAVMVILVLGLGLPNFTTYILFILVDIKFLGMNLLFWIIIAIGIFLTVFFLVRKFKRRKMKNETECELINGEWVCDVEKE